MDRTEGGFQFSFRRRGFDWSSEYGIEPWEGWRMKFLKAERNRFGFLKFWQRTDKRGGTNQPVRGSNDLDNIRRLKEDIESPESGSVGCDGRMGNGRQDVGRCVAGDMISFSLSPEICLPCLCFLLGLLGGNVVTIQQ